MNQLNKIAQDFSNAAADYDDFAHIQRQVIDKLRPWVAKGNCILDAGAGTGYALSEGWLALDIAEGMCAQIDKNPVICANMQQIPCKNAAFDGIFTSLATQWLHEPEEFLQEAHRCTKDEGWLVMGTLGSKTFSDLRDAFNNAGLFVPLLNLKNKDEWDDLLQQAGWKIEECKVEILATQHNSILELLNYIKGLGARNKQSPYKTMRGREWLATLENSYGNKINNRFNLTWEVIVIKAIKA